ncbi:g7628 [Coccomyxa viridis]|uniref:G7628 protein n=1 Tax=Coccomyxa viridis TaxID=1274662 RepID=A0ABP1FYC3_9CHLO
MSSKYICNFLKSFFTRKQEKGSRDPSSEDGGSFGKTRSYWLHREGALFTALLQLLKETGDPTLIGAIDDARTCVRALMSEPAAQHPKLRQMLLDRFDAACADLARAAQKDVPGGQALVEGLAQCEKVLMIPDTPVDFFKKPSLWSDHEVDLACLALPDQGERFQNARRGVVNAEDSAEDF